MTVTIHHGDCLEVLKQLPDCSVTAVVTDPPAGISFMSKAWDSDKGGPRQWIAWLTDILAECLRVLKPGGHALVWALPRTSHWTGTALELAGFEVRDQLVHIFGTGFPKNHDVSKAVDKRLGGKRQVVGSKEVTRDISGGSWSELHGTALTATTVDVTAPATPEAADWQGYGTALKPSHEVWWLARKPMEGSVAQNVLEHGAGALYIDGCRVGTTDDCGRAHNKVDHDSPACFGSGMDTFGGPGHSSGRWPPNLLLSHHPECRQIGTREVTGDSRAGEDKGSRPSGFVDTGSDGGDGKPAGNLHGSQTVPVMSCHTDCPVAELDRQSDAAGLGRVGYAGAHTNKGSQVVNFSSGSVSSGGYPSDSAGASRYFPIFRCHHDCAVAELDRQSGVTSTHQGTFKTDKTYSTAGFKAGMTGRTGSIEPSSGGASRYFPIFRYQAKATTAERDHGVKGPAKQTGFPMRSSEQDSNAEGGDGTRTHRQTTRKNLHPTVKSVALMRWLVSLVSSPSGTVVLDPFMGSGSTGVACVMNGVDFVGIEQQAEFCQVAQQRCDQAKRDHGVTAEDIKAGQAPDGPVQVKLW